MPAFAGVTFQERWEDGFSPLLENELYISVEHYPETDGDEIQTGGVGNGTLTIPAKIAAPADLAALRTAMRLGTVGTLTGCWDGSHASMKLVGIKSPRGAPDAATIFAELEFLEAPA